VHLGINGRVFENLFVHELSGLFANLAFHYVGNTHVTAAQLQLFACLNGVENLIYNL